MKKFVLALIMFLNLSSFAQEELKEKTKELTGNAILVYHFNNEKQINGAYYVKNITNKGVWLKGNYKANQPAGSWYFFNSENKLMLRYNFDDKKVFYLDPNFYNSSKINILSLDEKVKKNASVPIPLFPIDLLLEIAGKNGEIVDKIVNKETINTLKFITNIGEDGIATYDLKTMDDKILLRNINLKIKDFPMDWVASNYQGQPISSQLEIILNVNDRSGVDNSGRRVRWNF